MCLCGCPIRLWVDTSLLAVVYKPLSAAYAEFFPESSAHDHLFPFDLAWLEDCGVRFDRDDIASMNISIRRLT